MTVLSFIVSRVLMLLHYLTKLYLHLTLATMEDVHTLKVAAYN